MENKLEVGMYVRVKNGIIAKITKIDTSCFVDGREVVYVDDKRELFSFMICIEDIINASFNIIDLIEEGDYIRIITSAYFEPVYYSYGKLVIRDDIDISKYTNKFIAEVITKEQFEQIAYKVGE